MTKLAEILKDSAYRLAQFKAEHVDALEQSITLKASAKLSTPYVNCLVRGKPIKLTPEEAVRQLYVMVLTKELGYPISRIQMEYEVTFGREKKRADICVFDAANTTSPYILVEVKKPKLKDGKEQLKSYCNATGAPMGVWSNGEQISFYHRKDPNYFEDIPAIPSAHEKLSDILSERWFIDDLVRLDKLVNERKSLKDLILEMEDEVLANAGVDVFEELFKLIFTKLFDEMESGRDKKRHLIFKNYGDTETELKAKIQTLFDKARARWEGVFTDDAKIALTPSHLAVCVSSLEKVKLFNSNLDVVDEAFEYLINKSSKGEKGQYFTPRYVIDMCVKMLNPQEHETLIDTAAGSCGFPVHGIFHVWAQIRQDLNAPMSPNFTTEHRHPREIDYVQNKVFAIDFDEKAVRVGRTLNLIAGDGQTNVLHLNTLDYERWDEKTKDEDWTDIYGEGWKKLKKLRTDKTSNRDFGFDVLMANPPFAGDIKETRILAKYELAQTVSLDKINKVEPNDKNIYDETAAGNKAPTFPEFLRVSHETIFKKADGTYRKVKVKSQGNVGRDILFIERNLSFLKPGGRMAVVLPQGRLNNASDKDLREYLADHCRVIAVVGLHVNVFKPHASVKTSVLFVQKWNENASEGPLCPRLDDYPIFFATMEEPSKDSSGNKIYVKQSDLHAWDAAPKTNDPKVSEPPARYTVSPKDLNEFVLDEHEHLVVKHDLFSHNLKGTAKTPKGIAESFIDFARRENLSFVKSSAIDLNARHSSVGIKLISLSEQASRLDAEYFHPEFQRLLTKLRRQKLRIADVAELRKEKFLPANAGSDFRYIEIGGLTSDGFAVAEEIATRDAPSRATWIVRAGDVITSMVRPIRRLTALIDDEQDGCICSSGFVVLKPTQISPELLFAYLRHPDVCQVMNMYTTASMYPAISAEDILNLPIVLPSNLVAENIQRYIVEARKKRRDAEVQIAKASYEYSFG